MKKPIPAATPLTRLLALTLSTLLLAGPVSAQGAGADPDATFDAAYHAWDAGDYIPALDGFLELLATPAADRYFERIALLTGELFEADEVAPDGRSVQFSPDGRYAAYEVEGPGGPTTHVVALENGFRKVAELRGRGLVFSPAGGTAAYLAARGAPGSAQATRIVVRDLEAQSERELPDQGLLKTSLAYGPDGSTLFFVGGRAEDRSRSDIYALTEHATGPVAITAGAGHKADPRPVAGTNFLVYAITTRNPLPQPGGRPLAFGSASEDGFVVRNLANEKEQAFSGGSLSVAANGSALVYLTRRGDETLIQWLPVRDEAEPVTVLRTTDRVASPALSPDGRRIAYQRMTRDDWEVYLVGADGRAEHRLTREIQHDIFPRFLSDGRILAVMGEGRHRRSYIYDREPDGAAGERWTRRRLFHNNTVRTIAPEYEWAANRDGAKLLIVSERDGDTVSPERGVYLVHLDRRITRHELVERLQSNRAEEAALREKGERMYRVIADEVRAAVAEVSIGRLYGYQKAMFDFDSKFVTRPGNRRAAEFIFETLQSFGYEPEYQWFEARTRGGQTVRTANVLATLRGTTHPELIYVLSSHFDSVERGPGADDNTSGTSVLLETARVLATRPLSATIIFAAFSGEEAGLLGSREFMRQAPGRGLHIVGALNNDMLGWSNDHRLDNTIRYSNPGIRDVQHAAAFLFTDLITFDALYYKSTDAAAFYEVYGDIVGGIGSYPVLGNPNYHQATDRLETMNHELIRETAKTTTASLMLLASSPSRLTGLEPGTRAGDAVEVRWTASPEKDVRQYIVAWGAPDEPMRNRITVTEPRARLERAPAGTVVAVKAVNERGLEGWDWARTTLER